MVEFYMFSHQFPELVRQKPMQRQEQLSNASSSKDAFLFVMSIALIFTATVFFWLNKYVRLKQKLKHNQQKNTSQNRAPSYKFLLISIPSRVVGQAARDNHLQAQPSVESSAIDSPDTFGDDSASQAKSVRKQPRTKHKTKNQLSTVTIKNMIAARQELRRKPTQKAAKQHAEVHANDPVVIKPARLIQPKENQRYQAGQLNESVQLRKIREHAQYMLAASINVFDDQLTQKIKRYAFLYHFHRYILMWNFIAPLNSPERKLTYDMRNRVLHGSDQVEFDNNIINATTESMRQFLQSDIDHLAQDQEVGSQQFVNLPLYQLLAASHDAHAARVSPRKEESNGDFLLWVCQDMLPMMHDTYARQMTSHLSQEDYEAAYKMMVITLGEYAAPDRQRKLLNDEENMHVFARVLSRVRLMRDLLAHELAEPDEQDFNELDHQIADVLSLTSLRPAF